MQYIMHERTCVVFFVDNNADVNAIEVDFTGFTG